MDKEPKEQHLSPLMQPALAAKARLQTDRVSGQPVLLYPEGVVLLNETGAAIIKLCDGQHTFAEIVAELASHYQVTPHVLQDDVEVYIDRLHRHSLMELRNGDATSRA